VTEVVFGDLVGGDDEYAAVAIEPILGPVLDKHAVQCSRALRDVSRRLFVNKNEVETDAARSKVALRGECFAKKRGIGLIHAHEHDWVVARDSSTPKATLTRGRDSPRAGRNAKCWIGKV
jgi:hypothetical protein